MIATAVIVAVVVLAAVLLLAATRPDVFRIERAASIKATPEKIFGFINDFHQWTSWSPWENIDPALKRTYSGAASGAGTAYAWQGNRKVGGGSMAITATVPPSRITIKLDFLKPFEGHNTTEFTLERKGDATTVTWAMFKQGLANLKSIAEKQLSRLCVQVG